MLQERSPWESKSLQPRAVGKLSWGKWSLEGDGDPCVSRGDTYMKAQPEPGGGSRLSLELGWPRGLLGEHFLEVIGSETRPLGLRVNEWHIKGSGVDDSLSKPESGGGGGNGHEGPNRAGAPGTMQGAGGAEQGQAPGDPGAEQAVDLGGGRGCQDDWAIGWRVAGGGVLRVLTFRGKLQGSPCAWRSVHVWGQSRRGGCRRAGAQACEG